MTAYHNSPELKASTVALMKAHREADEIVQGIYWKDGKGCNARAAARGTRAAVVTRACNALIEILETSPVKGEADLPGFEGTLEALNKLTDRSE